jgi:hypothetical protein
MPHRKSGPFRPGMNSRGHTPLTDSPVPSPKHDAGARARTPHRAARSPASRAELLELHDDVELDPAWAAASGGMPSLYRMHGRARERPDSEDSAQPRPQTSLDLRLPADLPTSRFDDILPFPSGRRRGGASSALLWQQKRFLGSVQGVVRPKRARPGIRAAESADREAAEVFGDDPRAAADRAVAGPGRFLAARDMETRSAPPRPPALPAGCWLHGAGC